MRMVDSGEGGGQKSSWHQVRELLKNKKGDKDKPAPEIAAPLTQDERRARCICQAPAAGHAAAS